MGGARRALPRRTPARSRGEVSRHRPRRSRARGDHDRRERPRPPTATQRERRGRADLPRSPRRARPPRQIAGSLARRALGGRVASRHPETDRAHELPPADRRLTFRLTFAYNQTAEVTGYGVAGGQFGG